MNQRKVARCRQAIRRERKAFNNYAPFLLMPVAQRPKDIRAKWRDALEDNYYLSSVMPNEYSKAYMEIKGADNG